MLRYRTGRHQSACEAYLKRMWNGSEEWVNVLFVDINSGITGKIIKLSQVLSAE